MQKPLDDPASAFHPLRPRLLRIAYRMLGSVAEAEDVVQEAYLRWHQAEREQVREPAGFLVRVVTRLCLDVRKSARATREEYLGPWLPEPWFETNDEQTSDDITYTLMLALERLSPLERAAFLLHDVFGMEFSEVAQAIGRNATACRQLASRARARVRDARPRYPVSSERAREIAQAFFAASRKGELLTLQSLLAEDVAVHTDGGGKVLAGMRPILGRDKASRFFVGLSRKPHFSSRMLVENCVVDGLPGFVSLETGGNLQATVLDVEDNLIRAIYIVRNPDKLQHLSALAG